jgi:hypothetical protein
LTADNVHPSHGAGLRANIKKHWIISTLVAVIVLLVLWVIVRAVAKPKPKPAAPAPIPVTLAPVTLGNIDVYLDALGTVTPVYTVTVVSRVAGEITEVKLQGRPDRQEERSLGGDRSAALCRRTAAGSRPAVARAKRCSRMRASIW